MDAEIMAWLNSRADDMVTFAGEMVRIPSPPGSEGQLSQSIIQRLRQLDVPAEIDEIGNVLAGLPGPLESGGILFATHTDQAPAGAMPDPFSGDLRDGSPFGQAGPILWGRGSNGQKAALAAMTYALGALQANDVQLNLPVIMAGLIMEEGGGHIGPRYLNDERGFRPQWVVIGENTDMAVHTGHRGITNLRVIVQGKASHASVPTEGINALLSFADVCRIIEERSPELPVHPEFGPLTVTPTMLSVSPDVTNVVPESCEANLDCRVIPGWTPAQVRDLVAGWLKHAGDARGSTVSVEIRTQHVTTWTGQDIETDGCILPFSTSHDDTLVAAAVASVEEVTGGPPEVKRWQAATDGGYYGGELGLPTIGIAPGQAAYSHTVNEHVPAADIPRAAAVYANLALRLCGR